MTKLWFFPSRKTGEYIVPDGVVSIAEYAFAGSDISEINLPESLERIGKDAFTNCYYLEEITIPDGVTKINDGVFIYCESLKTVNLPETLMSIGNVSFYMCDIEKIYIPASVTEIHDDAFDLTFSDVVIIGIPGSYAEEYAKIYYMDFEDRETGKLTRNGFFKQQ
jgi:hypothetical protein